MYTLDKIKVFYLVCNKSVRQATNKVQPINRDQGLHGKRFLSAIYTALCGNHY